MKFKSVDFVFVPDYKNELLCKVNEQKKLVYFAIPKPIICFLKKNELMALNPYCHYAIRIFVL